MQQKHHTKQNCAHCVLLPYDNWVFEETWEPYGETWGWRKQPDLTPRTEMFVTREQSSHTCNKTSSK